MAKGYFFTIFIFFNFSTFSLYFVDRPRLLTAYKEESLKTNIAKIRNKKIA